VQLIIGFFSSFFLLRPFTVLMKKTRAFKQSIFLRCLWLLNIKSRTWYTLPKLGWVGEPRLKIESTAHRSIETQQFLVGLLGATTLSILTFSIKGLFARLNINDTQQNGTQYGVLLC
jgi:hypothetical protein